MTSERRRDLWNRYCPIGTEVRYWPTEDCADVVTTQTESIAWIGVQGDVVVKIVGLPAAVLLVDVVAVDLIERLRAARVDPRQRKERERVSAARAMQWEELEWRLGQLQAESENGEFTIGWPACFVLIYQLQYAYVRQKKDDSKRRITRKFLDEMTGNWKRCSPN